MNDLAPLSTYQRDFIDFLVQTEVLSFGDFVTKSGRRTPYFVNTGKFYNGSRISRMGQFFAAHIQKIGLSDVHSIFGPAYKGIPLCVATTLALYNQYDQDVGFTFNRKEKKEHGDGGDYVGAPLTDGDSILIVEDVITAGITLRETVQTLRKHAAVDIRGVIVSVDRCERGQGDLSASDEIEKDLDLTIYPLVTIHEVIEYLSKPNQKGFSLSSELIARMNAYLEEFGA
ncbi:MAG: orotate phosphoribosyltransferase [Bdellovibrionales bacterium]|nr:orotate phosphoribosyltransferase [Bdellovibrionales bacterium]